MDSRTGITTWRKERMDDDALGRDRVLGELNASTLDSVGPLGGDQGMKVLSEKHSLTDEHDDLMKNLAPRVDALSSRKKLCDNYCHYKQFSISASHRIHTMMGVG
jgi:hypothetical protein